MFREPKSKVFVLQATMRCLRAITDVDQQATIFLSKKNYDILNSELNKNFNMDIVDITNKSKDDKKIYKVRVLPPPRTITLKHIRHEYSLDNKEYTAPVDFELENLDCSKYESIMYERDSLVSDRTIKQKNIDDLIEKVKFSQFTLVGEIARYLNISCITVSKILEESVDGVDLILEKINKYNDIIYDVIIPKIFNILYEVKKNIITEDRELVLLKEPKDAAYYEFSAKEELVINNTYGAFSPKEIAKSFHADTYCFDSFPERECFMQYITSDKVDEIYFTGMFTSNQGDLSVQYYDPETRRIRQYYPDFLAKMSDGTYQLIEVKGDNKIDDVVVKAKAEAAEELAVASGIEYKMYAGSKIMSTHILDEELPVVQSTLS